MKHVVLPFTFILFFYLESVFVNLLPSTMMAEGRMIQPHFLLVLFLITTAFYSRNKTLLYGFLFGLLFDIYYTGILGIYLVLFPISIYTMNKLLRILNANLFTISICILLLITGNEFLEYTFALIVYQVVTDVNFFMKSQLVPTLIANFIFLLIAYFPLKHWLVKNREAFGMD